MLGVLPIGRQRENQPQQTAFFWSLKTGDFERWRRQGLDAWKDGVLRHWPEAMPLLESIIAPEQMILATYDHHTLALPFGPE
jgi:salicylate hydroxylase